MSPVFDLRNVRPSHCEKPGCRRHPTQRHHRGSELMWMRHFLHKRRQKKYRRFKERYYEFRASDVVRLCVWHHEEITAINFQIISKWARLRGPCRDWRWTDAERLIERLRKECDRWIKTETPGLEPHRLKEYSR